MRRRSIAWIVATVLGATLCIATGAHAAVTPPPTYIWGYGDPFPCGAPRPQDSAAARAEDRARGPLHLPASLRSQRILLIGDSTACSLWTGLREVGRAHGIRVWQGSVFGCGIASGQITTTRNEQITLHSERCPQMVDSALTGALARARPTLILWMSVWEKSDIVEDGKVLVNGTAAGDAAMLARMDAVLRRIDRSGARVGLLTVAAPAPNDAPPASNTSNPVDDAGYDRLHSIDRRFAARHRGRVFVVDLARKVCPSGAPCPMVLHGRRERPDGRHFDPAVAADYSRWVLRQLARHEG